MFKLRNTTKCRYFFGNLCYSVGSHGDYCEKYTKINHVYLSRRFHQSTKIMCYIEKWNKYFFRLTLKSYIIIIFFERNDDCEYILIVMTCVVVTWSRYNRDMDGMSRVNPAGQHVPRDKSSWRVQFGSHKQIYREWMFSETTLRAR